MGTSNSIRDRIKELRRVPARALLANPKNWRKHPKAQQQALRAILDEVGFAGALLARETEGGELMLIDGHLRAETAPDELVPVLILDVNEAEANKILLTFDPLSSLATIDQTNLESLIALTPFDSVDLSDLVHALNGQQKMSVSDPDAPAPSEKLQAKWQAATGQLWQMGMAKLYCSNNRDIPGALLPGMIRMIWTDPPYGVDYEGKDGFLKRYGKQSQGHQARIPGEELTSAELIEAFRRALHDVVKFCCPGAVCYAAVPPGPLLAQFVAAMNAAGFENHAMLVWLKHAFVLGRNDYHYRHESILYGWLTSGPHYWCGSRSMDSVFEIDRPMKNADHPTMKPVELVARMIENSSRPGELVYDPFCGSGSTLLAAEQLKRLSFGVEIEPAYVAVTLERFAALGIAPQRIQ